MNKIFRFAAAVITAVFALTNVTAFALSSEPTATATETVIEDSRTLTPKGNANLVDDVSEDENLQFITVTARDGNVFYFVIDHAAENENVYFLNTVDESDLAALVEDGKQTEKEKEPTTTETEKEKTEAEKTEETEKAETEKEQPEQAPQNNNMLLIIILLICGGGVAFYYFKVIIPKKKLEQADDIEDFEFEDEDEEEIDEPDEDEIEDYDPEQYEGEEILEDSIVYADDEEETE